MTNKLFFQVFLFGVAISEWVEITKVANENTRKLALPKIMISTPPSYEDILVRPQNLYEISATTPVQENVNNSYEVNNTVPSKNANKENMYENKDRIVEKGNTTSEETVESLGFKNAPTTKEYLEAKSNRKSLADDDINADDTEKDYGYQNNTKDDFLENESSRFLSVLKNVQRHLLNYKEKTLKGKIALLKDLRNNLLFEIKTRMSKLWMPTLEYGQSETRGYKDYYPDDHYHMDFPSNEGALITIGFLTFAVFLIKLVLKLIYTLKSKQQYYFPTTTTAASVFLKGNQREITQDQLEHSAKIMQYIEEYPLS